MNNITFNKLDFLGLASGSLLLTAFIYICYACITLCPLSPYIEKTTVYARSSFNFFLSTLLKAVSAQLVVLSFTTISINCASSQPTPTAKKNNKLSNM